MKSINLIESIKLIELIKLMKLVILKTLDLLLCSAVYILREQGEVLSCMLRENMRTNKTCILTLY